MSSSPTKTCSKCKVAKSTDDFYRSAKYKDGYRTDCKQCNRERARRWESTVRGMQAVKAARERARQKPDYVEKNRASVVKYQKTERGREVLRLARARYNATEKGKATALAFTRAYRKTPGGKAAYARGDRKRDQAKVRARKAVYQEIKMGRMVRGDCTGCGAPKAHAHHEDYSRPLAVVWMCRRCHDQHHAENG